MFLVETDLRSDLDDMYVWMGGRRFSSGWISTIMQLHCIAYMYAYVHEW
jgi:hypothetical protein